MSQACIIQWEIMRHFIMQDGDQSAGEPEHPSVKPAAYCLLLPQAKPVISLLTVRMLCFIDIHGVAEAIVPAFVDPYRDPRRGGCMTYRKVSHSVIG